MSLRTRINGYTAWANLRLVPYDSLLNNVLLDVIKGNHVQQLLHSMTGKTMKKLQSFEGLTQPQKVTRIEWFVDELKKSEVIPDDVRVDCRMFAMKSADHVFDLLWRLVAYDIWFTWERMEFLQQENDKNLTEIPFRWTPEPPPKKKKQRVIRTADTMMSGFGSSSQVVQDATPSPEPEGYEKFIGADKMKVYKPRRPRGGWYSYPSPDECILEMINSQLQLVSEGHKFTVHSLDDLVDSRALCGLINSFAPGTFTTEVMLNDRWTINLALQTAGKMLYASNPMGSGDLSEADPKSVCAYMCFFFMSCYKLKQSKAVINRLKELILLVQEVSSEISQLPEHLDNMQDLKMKKELQERLEEYQREQNELQDAYDIEYINFWLKHIREVQADTRKIIAEKMAQRFDLVQVPRNMTINDLCMSLAINLQLTQGSGFYRVYEKETCNPDRRIVLRDKHTHEFLDDFTGVQGSRNIRDLLGIPQGVVYVLEPSLYPDYEFYLESPSRNKTLRTNTAFLYQVFPGNTSQWQRLFFKAVRNGDLDVARKMVVFFSESHPDFVSSREPNTSNTVLHVASRFGHFDLCLFQYCQLLDPKRTTKDICKFLLESGCEVNAKNITGCTPLFFAAEGLHKRVAQLLIEWGCNTKIQNFSCQNAFDLMRHEDMKSSLKEIAQLWASTVPDAVSGRLEPMRRIVKDHMIGIRLMADVSARCLKGSTLLHTAVHFEDQEAIKNLLKVRVDVNLRDYQGATPLHRAKALHILELLLDSNADINAPDNEGNIALHVRAYGEKDKPSFVEGIRMMMGRGADVTHRNKKGLMPVHCAAMQGRREIIELILEETDDAVRSEVDKEMDESPPSLPYLAMAGNHLACAKWLVQQGFLFKSNECNKIIYKILTQELVMDERDESVRFLLSNGGLVNLRYANGDTSVHLATRMSGPADVIRVLFEFGARVDGVNNDGATGLFDAMKTNNFEATSVLIEQGADVRWKNNEGLTSLDLVHDYDEWIACPLFSDDIIARFKAYKLKSARDLIRSISRKIQDENRKVQAMIRQNINLNRQPFLSLPGNRAQTPGTGGYLQRGTSPVPRFPAYSFPALAPPVVKRAFTPKAPTVTFSRKLALPPVSIPQPPNRDSPQLAF